jgi:hypothetical protein
LPFMIYKRNWPASSCRRSDERVFWTKEVRIRVIMIHNQVVNAWGGC